VSSLWTPEGEHRVPRQQAGGGDDVARDAEQQGGTSPSHFASGALDVGGDIHSGDIDGGDIDEAAVRAEMEALERQLAETPAQDVIANHCYGMFQLAALHLGQQPPRLEEASLAIDAFAAVVESLGARLGPAEETLRDGLAQIRLAFVQIAAAHQVDPGAT